MVATVTMNGGVQMHFNKEIQNKYINVEAGGIILFFPNPKEWLKISMS